MIPPTLARGIDAAWSPPPVTLVASLGYVALGRYYGGSNSKRLTPAEASGALGAGLIPFTVMEGGTTMALSPGSAVAVAGEALREAAAVGQPLGTTLFFACDTDPSGQEAVVTDFFQRVAAVVRPAGYLVGFYGQGQLGGRLKAAGIVDRLWATVAWSRGFVPDNADLLQILPRDPRIPQDHDINLIFTADFGGWRPLTGFRVPPPFPPPLSGGSRKMYERVDDKATGGHWLSDDQGRVMTFCAHGFPNGQHSGTENCGPATSPPYKGNLTDHPEWNAGTPVGFIPSADGSSYGWVCQHPDGTLSPYVFA